MLSQWLLATVAPLTNGVRHLGSHFLVGLASAAFAAGGAYVAVQARLTALEERLNEQRDLLARRISETASQREQLTRELEQINIRLSVLEYRMEPHPRP